MIAIIGGSGFIGTEFMKLLDKQLVSNLDKVTSTSFPEQTVIGDVRKSKDLLHFFENIENPGESFVVLLAAEHRDDVNPVSLYYDVNVEGTRNVVAAMEAKGIQKIIFTSSVAVYGLNKENPGEDHPVDPFNHYGKSKYQAEDVLREWYNRDTAGRTLIIIRPTVVFGPKNRGNVYNLLKQISSGKFLMIGDGKNKKSMAYVSNITRFLQFCIEENLSGYQLFNYADKPDLNMNELVKIAEDSLGESLPPVRIPYWLGYTAGIGFDLLAKLTGKKLPVSAVRVKKFCATTQFANNAVVQSGFTPPYSLAEGLKATIDDIRSSN